MLQNIGISHYEEPCPYWEIEQTKEVADALDIDVTGGEQDCCFPIWQRMIDLRAVDIVQPDICYIGGMPARCRSRDGRAPAFPAPRIAPTSRW